MVSIVDLGIAKHNSNEKVTLNLFFLMQNKVFEHGASYLHASAIYC